MRNEELKDLLQLHTQAIKAEIKATTDLLGYKVDEVINHQMVTNGRVTKLEEWSMEHGSKINPADRVVKNWKIYMIGTIIFIFSVSLVAAWAYHNVNIQNTIFKKLDIELKNNG